MARSDNRHDAAVVKLLEKGGAAILRLDNTIDGYTGDDIWLDSFTLQTPYHTGEDYRIVARATIGGKAVVAFHGGSSAYDCLVGFLERWDNRSLKWRDDQYAK